MHGGADGSVKDCVGRPSREQFVPVIPRHRTGFDPDCSRSANFIRFQGKGVQVMLVLSRKLNEEIVIGNNVTIKVVRIIGNKVRLGISAPRSVTIRRGEVEPPMLRTIDLPRDQFDAAEASLY